jgi:hypothetical protein
MLDISILSPQFFVELTHQQRTELKFLPNMNMIVLGMLERRIEVEMIAPCRRAFGAPLQADHRDGRLQRDALAPGCLRGWWVWAIG